MNSIPSYDLEMKAAEERERLHSSVVELKSRLNDTLDVRRNIREHLPLACSVAVLLGIATGYAVAGIFTRT